MLDGEAAVELTAAVRALKARAGTGNGGSFHVNEFGQVLVSVSDESDRHLLAGEWHGPLWFEDVFEDDRAFDLCSTTGLSTGSPWHMPYVGIPHKVCADGRIGFAQPGWAGARTIYPPRQDEQLADTLCRLRGYSGCRFVVAPGGIVLTKVTPRHVRDSDEGGGRPIYVGRINFQRWFAKES